MAVKYTKNPQDVAKVMDFLAQEDVYREFTERSLFIPAHKAVLAGPLDYQTDDPQVKAALDAFIAAAATTSPEIQKLPAWRWSDAIYGALATRIGQAAAGELSPEEAFARIDADVAQKVKDSGL